MFSQRDLLQIISASRLNFFITTCRMLMPFFFAVSDVKNIEFLAGVLSPGCTFRSLNDLSFLNELNYN